MYTVYILCSECGHCYVGSTDDVKKRIEQHNSKQYRGWTNRYDNWRLVHSEVFATRTEALRREREIKSMKGGHKFRELIGGS